MTDGVLDERLQEQMRTRASSAGGITSIVDAQAIAEPCLLDRQVRFRISISCFTLTSWALDRRLMEQSLSRSIMRIRGFDVAAHQARDRVQRVEEECGWSCRCSACSCASARRVCTVRR